MNYHPEQPWTPLSESLLVWEDSFHDLMLDDQLRMNAYRKAIGEVVRPGDMVIDLGTGTGILAQWALDAGAANVIGIEMNATVLARAVERMNKAGYSDRFIPIHKRSYDVHVDLSAHVLISEIIGNMADNENFQPVLADAIRRFLAPGGRVLPLSVSSFIAPVAAPKAHAALRAGKVASLAPLYDIQRLYAARKIGSPFDIYYDCILPAELYLDAPHLLCRYDDGWSQAPTYGRELTFDLTADGALTGFKVYFVAALSSQTTLDISSGDIAGGGTSDSWKHAYLPIQTPIDVRSGDVLHLTFSRRYPNGDAGGFQQLYEWRGSIERRGATVGRFEQTMGR